MREANRNALIRAVVVDPSIDVLHPFSFSRRGIPAIRKLPANVVYDVAETLRTVGGKGALNVNRLERFVGRLGSDDCLLIDGNEFVVEYDESLHFTPFRAVTLKSKLYNRLRVGFRPGDYLAACGTARMTGGSKRAHSDSPHRDFKCPVRPGECRHRQRAFYDFLKDVLLGFGLHDLPRIIRISDLTDFIGGRSPQEIEEAGTTAETQALRGLIRERAKKAMRRA
jgi:hypothetical protein